MSERRRANHRHSGGTAPLPVTVLVSRVARDRDDAALAGWADELCREAAGFRGHLATKSRRYSTTLGRLRAARRDSTRQHLPHRKAWPVEVGQDQAEVEETTLVVGSWRFAGMGWLNNGDAALAAASAARARDD